MSKADRIHSGGRLSLILGAVSTSMLLMVLYIPAHHLAGITTIAVSLAILAGLTINQRRLFLPLLVGLFLRTLLALAYTAMPELDPDPDGYGWRASEWAMHGLSGVGEHFTTGAYLYSWLISLLYATVGESQFTVRMFNVLFGTLIVWCVYVLTFQLWHSKRLALRAAWIAALFPNLIRFSASFPSREVIIVLPFMLGVIFFISWVGSRKLIYLFGSLIGFLCSISMHAGMLGGLIAVTILIVGVALRQLVRGHLLSASRNLISFSLVGVALTFIWAFQWGLERIDAESSLEALFGVTLTIGTEAAMGRAAYLQGIEINTLADVLWVIPLRILYFLFTPFPWMVESPLDILGFADALLYLTLVVIICRSKKYLSGNILAQYVIVITFIIIAVFAAATGNYGTAIRHRAKVAPLLIPVAVVMLIRKYPRLEQGASRGRYETSAQS